MFFRFVTNHACDRRTDGQNYDPQDRASIDASRGKNPRVNFEWSVSSTSTLFFVGRYIGQTLATNIPAYSAQIFGITNCIQKGLLSIDT